MEKFAHLIQTEVEEDNWKPFRLKKSGTCISHLFFADDLMLFAEADMDQAAIIKACLDDFCAASGEKVNNMKSRIFFSKNVNHTKVNEISNFMGFSPCVDLGRYLGVPLIHQKVTRRSQEYILGKMDKKLSQWKANTLSSAAHYTLVHSVVSVIPSYDMQTISLLSSTCNEIDKRCRKFLWGGSEARSKVNLVSWDKVCMRKEVGGLGLRKAKLQNNAFMMKLGWSLINRKDVLWVQLMREKYGCGLRVMPHINSSRAGSQVWKGVKNIWSKVQNDIFWQLGNGNSIRF